MIDRNIMEEYLKYEISSLVYTYKCGISSKQILAKISKILIK